MPMVDGINWGPDYPKLTDLMKRDFGDALAEFVDLTRLGSFMGTGNDVAVASELLRDRLCGPNGLVPANTKSVDDSPDFGITATRRAFDARASAYSSQYSSLIHPAFGDVIKHAYGDMDAYFASLSDELGGYDPRRRSEMKDALRGFDCQDTLSSRGIGRVSYGTMLYVLLMKRFKHRVYPFSERPVYRDDLRDKTRNYLTVMMLENQWALELYRSKAGDLSGFPIEAAYEHDSEKIEKFCMAVLRLVLGESKDLSEVLQEDFISNEIMGLAHRHGFGDRIKPYIDALRDLRMRLFVANYLTSTPANLVTGTKMGEPCFPIAAMANPKFRTGADLGSGQWAWFANAAAMARPGMRWWAYDRLMPDLTKHLGPGGGPGNLSLGRLDLNDGAFADRIIGDFDGKKVDIVSAANVFHKTDDPDRVLRTTRDRVFEKVLVIVAPAFSDHQYEGLGMDPDSIVIWLRQDTTHRAGSVFSFERWQEAIRKNGLKIIGISRLGRRGENDIGVPRFSFVLAKEETANRVVKDVDFGCYYDQGIGLDLPA